MHYNLRPEASTWRLSRWSCFNQVNDYLHCSFVTSKWRQKQDSIHGRKGTKVTTGHQDLALEFKARSTLVRLRRNQKLLNQVGVCKLTLLPALTLRGDLPASGIDNQFHPASSSDLEWAWGNFGLWNCRTLKLWDSPYCLSWQGPFLPPNPKVRQHIYL